MKKRMAACAGLAAAAMVSAVPAAADYEARGKRDPFVPLINSQGQRVHPPGAEEGQAGGVGNLVLQGVVFDPKAESFAVISGQVVREQEEFEGVKVVRIEPDAVTVRVDGQNHRLTVQQDDEQESTEEKSTP